MECFVIGLGGQTGQDLSSNPQDFRTMPSQLRGNFANVLRYLNGSRLRGISAQALIPPFCVNTPFPIIPTGVWSEDAENELKEYG